MTKVEVKKALYKQKPTAYLLYIRGGNAYYYSELMSGENIHFEVPVSDMGDADFKPTMEGKLLIRWLQD